MALEDYEDINLLILSADHVIKEISVFKETLKTGFKYAEDDNLVTFGIVPNRPETGYGYIRASKPISEKHFKGEKIEEFL